MVITYARFEIGSATEDQQAELDEVAVIAQSMRGEMLRVSDQIDLIHRWGTRSDDIQRTFFPWLSSHFRTVFERRVGFEESATPFNRPDAQVSLDASRPHRIIIEVERGGTVTNNHDLKDLWKTHLSITAKHLFLVVPNSIVDKDGKQRPDNAFRRCTSRLSSFFGDPRTQVDVWSLHLFGYGPAHT